MRLFYQLAETEQNDVVHHCCHMVIQDMIDDGIRLEPVSEEEQDLKNKLEDAMVQIKQFATDEEKADYLFSDPVVSKAIYDIALEMAKSAFYHEDEELVIFPATLSNDNAEDVEDIDGEKLLPPAPNMKKNNTLN